MARTKVHLQTQIWLLFADYSIAYSLPLFNSVFGPLLETLLYI